ncbi:uncharacterized protein LOC113847878 isoform X1 [Abrus precatorius]|uniref:Uncharacterized protein LOC113847878 isoform X1 n=1 Tax=Abrus precatorius TaxID=3816 RepID=A0A8B8JQX3_ABRPR|nr:uncharacterized protein LOC113847878 isoform X1 [Abrus precatorius]
MGFSKEEKSKRILRGVKTLFFLITMVMSLLLFSAPVLLVIADALVPSALLSALYSPSSLSLQTLFSHFENYDFRYSLIDIPLLSIIRSLVIFCVYSFCDGPRLSRGPYLGITTVCSVMSLIFVSLKAVYVFSFTSVDGASQIALFVCSCALAVGHIVVAYRTSCRERRKLLVYKIDIEAVRVFILLFYVTTQYRKEVNDICLFSGELIDWYFTWHKFLELVGVLNENFEAYKTNEIFEIMLPSHESRILSISIT